MRSKVTNIKVKGHVGQVKGQIRIPEKGRWAHNNVKLLHPRFKPPPGKNLRTLVTSDPLREEGPDLVPNCTVFGSGVFSGTFFMTVRSSTKYISHVKNNGAKL